MLTSLQRHVLKICGQLTGYHRILNTPGIRNRCLWSLKTTSSGQPGALRIVQTISTSMSLDAELRRRGPPTIVPSEPLPPRPTDELVRKLLASEDMKRTLGRELRKCGGDINSLNYSRLMYDAWNGFSEQIILAHVESGERLIQLISEAMAEDPALRAFIENSLDVNNERGRRNAPYGLNLLGTKHLSWYLSGAALIMAFFNYYLTAILLFASAVYLTFFVL